MRPHRRLAPLALLSALTLTSACTTPDKDEPAATQPAGTPSSPAKPSPQPAAPLPTVATPTTDSRPAAAIGTVIATVHVPSGTAMTDLAAVVDNLKPGASALLKMQVPSTLGQMMGMDLAGAKLTGPLSLIVLDPLAHPKPLALLVEVENLDVLTESAKTGGNELRSRDGRALIGPADVVAAAETFAFDNLTQPLDHSEIVIYPLPLMNAMRPQIDQALAQMNAALSASASGPNAAKFIDIYIKALTAMAEQTDRMVISVAASQTSTDLFMRMYPTKGSALEAFTQAQVPSDHALLAKLPGGTEPPALMSGTLLAGGAREALLDWTIEFMRSTYASQLSREEWMRILGAWLDTSDGRFATTIDLNLGAMAGQPGQGGQPMGMRFGGLLGATDSNAMRTAWRDMIVGMTGSGGPAEIMGMRFTMSLQSDALEHDGVPVDLFRTTIDASQMPPEQQAMMKAMGSTDQAMHIATFDQFGVMASADTDGAAVRSFIDAARGKSTTYQPSASVQAAIDSSVQNGESLIYYIDFAKLLSSAPTPVPVDVPFSGVVMGLGRHGEALSTRVSLRK
jgi:hypothetical protein